MVSKVCLSNQSSCAVTFLTEVDPPLKRELTVTNSLPSILKNPPGLTFSDKDSPTVIPIEVSLSLCPISLVNVPIPVY